MGLPPNRLGVPRANFRYSFIPNTVCSTTSSTSSIETEIIYCLVFTTTGRSASVTTTTIKIGTIGGPGRAEHLSDKRRN